MSKIKIGDFVMWRGGWGLHAPQKTSITGIELCQNGDNQGIPVDEIDAELKDHCVFDLYTGNWAYGDQIELITE